MPTTCRLVAGWGPRRSIHVVKGIWSVEGVEAIETGGGDEGGLQGRDAL